MGKSIRSAYRNYGDRGTYRMTPQESNQINPRGGVEQGHEI